MMHEIGVALQSKLRARGCPFTVVDREGTKPTTWARDRIVIEHVLGGDAFTNTISQRSNPKHRMQMASAGQITIYAQSAKAGALPFEHENRALRVVDMVLVAMSEILAEEKATSTWVPDGGGFVKPEDFEGTERFGGAVYQIVFHVPRAVQVRDWDGDAAETVTVTEGMIQSEVRVAQRGDEENYETASGG